MAWWLSVGGGESQDPGSNKSYVSATVYLNWNNRQSYAGYGGMYGEVNIGGTPYGYYAPDTVNYPNGTSTGSVAMASFTKTYLHDPNGYRGAVGTSAYLNGSGGYAPGYLSAGGQTFGAIDYSRPSASPTWCQASNVSNTITFQWNEASAPFGPITYYWIYRASSDGGATWGGWSGETSTSGLSTSGTYSPGQTYQFAVRASNSDGGGGWLYSNTVFLTAGGKRWTGNNWALTTGAAKRYTGSTWTNITIAKRFDGNNWVNLS